MTADRRGAVIALAQTKGGVGKTTLAVNIAIELAREGGDVLLVDADDQQTAADFTALRAEQLQGQVGYTAVSLAGANVRTQVLALRSKYDYVVIDVGGRDTGALRAALTVADIVISPFMPRSFDVWTLDKMATLISEARIVNPDMKAFALLNSADPQGSDNAEAAEALQGNPELQYLDAPIIRRKAFPNAASVGLAVTEPKRRNADAAAELQILVQELQKIAGKE